MIPAIGLIVAVYACARLLQVPLEHSGLRGRHWWLAAISLPAILVIAVVTIGLQISGLRGPLADGLTGMTSSQTVAPTGDREWRERLLSIVTAAGYSCGSVIQTFHQGGDGQTQSTWNVACESGTSYVISLKSGATPAVTNCQLARVTCFTRFAP